MVGRNNTPVTSVAHAHCATHNFYSRKPDNASLVITAN
jgi:hypothetical protein